MEKNEISQYLKSISLVILGIFLFIFPLTFTTLTTDSLTLPKQVLLGIVVLISIVLYGAKMINEGAVRIRRTPYDLPIFLFGLFAFLSSIFSLNRLDSLINFTPFLFAILAFYIIINTAKDKSSVLFLSISLVSGAAFLSIFSFLTFLKIYILPFSFTHSQGFTPFGSMLDQAVYLVLILLISVHFTLQLLSRKDFKMKWEMVFGVASIIILIGSVATFYGLFTTQKPTILPFETGFQTAFAAISQDTGRVATGFLFGSGFGTYATDFLKFKQQAFNQSPLWSFTFFRSSSFVLELLATTGILGFLSYLLLVVKILKNNHFLKKIKENAVFLSLVLVIVASFILPLTFVTQVLLFILLGLSVAYSALSSRDKFYDVELHFVAFKNGFVPISSLPVSESKELAKLKQGQKFLPITFFVLFTLISGILGFYLVSYTFADATFQHSLVAASSNNGLQTYNDQVNAIKIFPYRDAYYRIYSQTNLALANSLAAQQPKNSSPSAQVQQTIYTLIQQSINAGRTAVTVSPQTVANWQNLSSIYRSLIGFGQNAENFAILTNQQAVVLSPNDPQGYINLGGIYFQLGQWDNAQRQFQIAIGLKPDLANAYYNLGHALEAKGDLQNALAQYQAVKSLTSNDPANLKKIISEIEALEDRIGGIQEEKEASSEAKPTTKQKQPPLSISTPSAKLPQQKPPVKIPPPQDEESDVSPTPDPTSIPTPQPNL